MIGMTAMTTEEDDFADFQAAPPTTTQPAVSQPSGKEHATVFEPAHDKTSKMACAPSKDLDQPGHPPSLIRVLNCMLSG